MSTYSVTRGVMEPAIWKETGCGCNSLKVLVLSDTTPEFFEFITRAVAAQDLLARDPEVLRAAVELAEAFSTTDRALVAVAGMDDRDPDYDRSYQAVDEASDALEAALARYREVRDVNA